jgi:hypothetical protein
MSNMLPFSPFITALAIGAFIGNYFFLLVFNPKS